MAEMLSKIHWRSALGMSGLGGLLVSTFAGSVVPEPFQPVAFWFGLALITAAAGWLVFDIARALWRGRTTSVVGSLPIALSEVRFTAMSNYVFQPGDQHDCQMIDLGSVVFTNLSRTDAAILDLKLLLTAREPDRLRMVLNTDHTDYHGQQLEARHATDSRLRGEIRRNKLIRSPLRIEPQTAATGRLVFLQTTGVPEIRNGLVGILARGTLVMTLQISDHISGQSVELELPATYRGKAAA